jgi:hypothetical protein
MMREVRRSMPYCTLIPSLTMLTHQRRLRANRVDMDGPAHRSAARMRSAYVALEIRKQGSGPVIEKGRLSACAGASVERRASTFLVGFLTNCLRRTPKLWLLPSFAALHHPQFTFACSSIGCIFIFLVIADLRRCQVAVKPAIEIPPIPLLGKLRTLPSRLPQPP